LWEGILGEGEIFKLLNLHPLPIPLPLREREVILISFSPLREREVILTLRNTCY